MSSGVPAMRLLCPVVKDATDIEMAEVRVIDRSDRDEVKCTLRSMKQDGVVLSDETQSTGIADVQAGGQVLTFGGQPAEALGYYALDCFVPSRSESAGDSGIVSYTIFESD